MSNVGDLLRECRYDARPKITQGKVADVIHKDVSYITKIERNVISLVFSGIEAEKIAQLFRENNVARPKIDSFLHACETARITGTTTQDKDSDLLQMIYKTLQEMDEQEKLAYRKELRDRNDAWYGLHQVNENFRQGKTTFDEAEDNLQRLEKIEENSVSHLKSRIRLENSRVLRYQGKTGLATTKLSHAIELAQKAGDETLLVEALKERGDFYRRSKQEEIVGALEDYEQIYEIYEKQNNEMGKANARIRIASILLTSGLPKFNSHTALNLCDDGLKYAKITRSSYLERKSLEYKAWTFFMMGKLDQALQDQLSAHKIVEEDNGEPKELAKSATYLAGFYLACGMPDEAEKWYAKADNHVKQIFRERGEGEEEREIFIRALIYLGLGTIKSMRPTERLTARSHLEKSLDYANQSNDSLTYGRSLLHLGLLDLEEENYSAAKEKFEVARKSFKKSSLDRRGNPYYLSDLNLGCAELEYRLGHYEEAQPYLEEIEALASEFEFSEFLIKIRLFQAKLLAATDLQKNEEKIIDLFLVALPEAQKTDIHILRNSLESILVCLELAYKEKKQAYAIEIINKLLEQTPKRFPFETLKADHRKIIEAWMSNMRSLSLDWNVFQKTLKPDTTPPV